MSDIIKAIGLFLLTLLELFVLPWIGFASWFQIFDLFASALVADFASAALMCVLLGVNVFLLHVNLNTFETKLLRYFKSYEGVE